MPKPKKKKKGKKKKKIDKKKGRKKKKKVEEVEEDIEEEEIKPVEIFIPKIWRLADTHREDEILAIIDLAVEKQKKSESEEEGEDEKEPEPEPEQEEEGEEEEGEEEEGEEGEKKKKIEEKPMTLNELLSTVHPVKGWNLLIWASKYSKKKLVRKLLGFGEKSYGFAHAKMTECLKRWQDELEKLHKLDLSKLDKKDDDEEDDEEDDDEEKPDFFKTQAEEMEVTEESVKSICKLGVYEGERNSLGSREGYCRIAYPNADLYFGEIKNNQKSGNGLYIFAKGGMYIGAFKNDQKHAFNAYIKYPNGDIFQGGFREGKRHGHGIIRYANLDLYYGNWLADRKHGQGVYEFVADGSAYKGVWEDGQFKKGLWCLKNTSVYKGDFAQGRPGGRGLFYFPKNGVKQTGQWVDGEWVMDAHGDMKKDDFEVIKFKESRKVVFYVVTGKSFSGKTVLFERAREELKENPVCFFLTPVCTRPPFCCAESYDSLAEEDFEKLKEEEFEFVWENAGFKYALRKKSFSDLRVIHGEKVIVMKVDKLPYAWLDELKKKNELKIINVVCPEEELKKRKGKMGIVEEESQEGEIDFKDYSVVEVKNSEGVEDAVKKLCKILVN